jgi:hypothetical protein
MSHLIPVPPGLLGPGKKMQENRNKNVDTVKKRDWKWP